MIRVDITDDQPPVAGEQYILSLIISGNEHLNSDISYQWTKDGTNIAGANSDRYLITTLQLSNRGEYACKVTISSVHLNGDYVISDSFEVSIKGEYFYFRFLVS